MGAVVAEVENAASQAHGACTDAGTRPLGIMPIPGVAFRTLVRAVMTDVEDTGPKALGAGARAAAGLQGFLNLLRGAGFWENSGLVLLRCARAGLLRHRGGIHARLRSVGLSGLGKYWECAAGKRRQKRPCHHRSRECVVHH